MPEIQIDRIYTIGEVAEKIGENVPNIRYWSDKLEFEGLVKPVRNAKGTRRYTFHDFETFQIVNHLVKDRKFTLEGAVKKIRDNRGSERKNLEIVRKLENMKKLLLEVKELIK